MLQTEDVRDAGDDWGILVVLRSATEGEVESVGLAVRELLDATTGDIVLDLSRCGALDGTVLGRLMTLRRTARTRGRSLRIHAPDDGFEYEPGHTGDPSSRTSSALSSSARVNGLARKGPWRGPTPSASSSFSECAET